MKIYENSIPPIHRLIKTDSSYALIFVAGLGATLHQQREAFIARFADKNKLNYLSFDTTQKAYSCQNLTLLETKAAQTISLHFSYKRLIFCGTCFGGVLAMRLANTFVRNTDFVLLTSPAINYCENYIFDKVIKRVEIKKTIAKTKDQLTNLCLLEKILKMSKDFSKPQPTLYQGPITILHPEYDNIIPLENSHKMVKKLNRSNVALQVLENDTHMLKHDFCLNAPIKVLSDFLQRQKS